MRSRAAGWIRTSSSLPFADCTASLCGRAPALRCGPRSVGGALRPLADRVQDLRFEQWVFAVQWRGCAGHAASKGVLLFGDLPIFVSLDSADVWASRELFRLDEEVGRSR